MSMSKPRRRFLLAIAATYSNETPAAMASTSLGTSQRNSVTP